MFENGMLTTSDEKLQGLLDSFAWYSPHMEATYRLTCSLNKQKEELIKSKIIEKGFGYLLEDLEIRRFPKLCCVQQGEWDLYFADDDSKEGAFIIAIKHQPTYNDDISDKNAVYSVKATIEWQDSLPLINEK